MYRQRWFEFCVSRAKSLLFDVGNRMIIMRSSTLHLGSEEDFSSHPETYSLQVGSMRGDNSDAISQFVDDLGQADLSRVEGLVFVMSLVTPIAGHHRIVSALANAKCCPQCITIHGEKFEASVYEKNDWERLTEGIKQLSFVEVSLPKNCQLG